MARLLIVVPATRRACGRATLVAHDGRALLRPLRVLATASRAVAKKHGNPERDRSKPFGHPPAGGYVFAGSLPPGYWPKPRRGRRFGTSGAILLAAESGAARTAATQGRSLFYVHGGPSDRKGRLRPTRGGFRMLDRDLAALLRAINDAHAAGDPLERVEVIDVDEAGAVDPTDLAATRKRRRKRALRKKESTKESKKLGLSAPRGPVFAGIPAGGPALAIAAKLLGGRTTDPRKAVSRREVVALALIVTAVAGCSDEPSSCEPVVCDPDDASCQPSAGTCRRRYSGGWSRGGGDGTWDDSGGGG